MSRLLPLLLLMALPLTGTPCHGNDRVAEARQHVEAELKEHFGKPVFLRIIKEDYELELWLQEPDGKWRLFDTYEIAAMSGELGPKTKEGDEQAPEGFYRVLPRAMNPRSMYHLSFNIGYPNAYDRSLGRTGSYIMVHGSDVSIGCFAMTDPIIEEIYTLVNEAFRAGVKSVPVQVYPFRMTEERMQEEVSHQHFEFWQHLLPGWQYTEQHKAPYEDSDSDRP
ncbi:MAG: 2-dehydro-3-deoxyphosphooctonate aldolase [Akkermansia sp.]|nr:2-dehydro-3-deoxyphosphooctonate aldolase [Akkermansia sp.]